MDSTAALEAKAVDACAKHKREHWAKDNYRAAVRVDSNFFVKFGSPTDLVPEIETQKHIFHYAASSHPHGAPRIPGVLHYFERDGTMYLVMEFIELLPTPPDLTKVAASLSWLAAVPAPPSHVLGPLGGGRIRHRFFKDA